MRAIYFRFIIFFIVLASCTTNQHADLIIYNGQVYSVNSAEYQEAIAIKNGKIIAIGSDQKILTLKDESTTIIDAHHQFVMPGFIEGHGHFSSLGKSKTILNFNRSKNWSHILSQVYNKALESNKGDWIIGRGWHQEKWDRLPLNAIDGYPLHDSLSLITNNNPVMLNHASGHSLFANKKAMDIAGVNREFPDPEGGSIIRDQYGNPTGVFTENAMDIITNTYQNHLNSLPKDQQEKKWFEEVNLAQLECLENGVTSFQDAASTPLEIERYNAMALDERLKVRLWVMLYGTLDDLKNITTKNKYAIKHPFFEFNAVKVFVDGALGSRGAWLLESYNDKKNNFGHNLVSIEELEEIAEISKAHNMQLCTHAIGDRGNREVLNIFEKTLQKEDRRWRIEHAQHLHLDDIPRFKELNVLASMQTNHCTSDAPYVEKRLGYKRSEEGAYVWRSLLEAGAKINIGTDVPVEDLNPIENFYAAVTRKGSHDSLAFFPKQSLTRAEAIYGYTIANAYAAFQENEKGSLEVGKMADIIILSNNLLECKEEDILKTKVMMTIINGKVVWDNVNR